MNGKIYGQPGRKGCYKIVKETDEEGCALLKFYNQNGLLALSRKVAGADEYSTYYIYDARGNLSVIVPPAIANDMENGMDIETSYSFNRFAFIYKYDGQHRCIYKKLPACEPVYYIYDKAGKLIFSQDGNQREHGEWSFCIPDIFGREVVRGVCKNDLDYQAEPLKNLTITAAFENTEEFYNYIGYKIRGVELKCASLRSAKFYDNYSFIGSLGIPYELKYKNPNEGYGAKYKDSKGQLTGEYLASFPQGVKFMAYYYDDKGQVIEQITNDFSTTDVIFFCYDYNGRVTRKRRSFTDCNKNTITEVYTNTYDHAGRLTKIEHKIGNAPKITLVENQYDELGRLKSVTRNSSPTLTTLYDYNVRSWIKSLSTPYLFTEKLFYTEQHRGNTPRYDGNISAMTWNANERERGYYFTYDGLCRLTTADYYENGSRSQHYDTSYIYNKDG